MAREKGSSIEKDDIAYTNQRVSVETNKDIGGLYVLCFPAHSYESATARV